MEGRHRNGRQDVCSEHNRPLDAYCCTDDQVICAYCAMKDHTGHTFGLVKEERRRNQDEVRKLKMRCQKYLQQQTMKKMLDQIKEKARETEDFCEAVLTSVIGLLQSHYMSIKELVQEQERKAVSETQKRDAGVKARCSQLDRLIHTNSDIDFLREWPTLRQCCEKDLQEATDNQLLPFDSIQNAVETLGSQIEQFCNNGFAAIHPNSTGSDEVTENDHVQQTDSDSDDQEITEDNSMLPSDEDSYDVYEVTSSVILSAEPQTREDFLQYACNLTLDPDTAHKDLHLSQDLKEVKLAPPNLRGTGSRSPERFIRHQVLCKEGLQADRSYYEIKITKSNAEIALAYKGINRKSRGPQSAFGGNAKSWSLDCGTGHYSVSHKGAADELISVPEHYRIGVYVKFREGTVTFYEVSNTMKFLYKIEANFTEPLYPGFWIGESCCIKICYLR